MWFQGIHGDYSTRCYAFSFEGFPEKRNVLYLIEMNIDLLCVGAECSVTLVHCLPYLGLVVAEMLLQVTQLDEGPPAVRNVAFVRSLSCKQSLEKQGQ